MTDRVFFDTNILIYGLDPSDPDRRSIAAELMASFRRKGGMVTSPQTLNECYRVLTDRRKLMARGDARAYIEALIPTCTAPVDVPTTLRAWEIQESAGFAWWDCLMMSSALAAGCKVYLTEDAQSGRSIRGMTLINPFRDELPRLLDQS